MSEIKAEVLFLDIYIGRYSCIGLCPDRSGGVHKMIFVYAGLIEVVLYSIVVILQKHTKKPIKFLFELISVNIVYLLISAYFFFEKNKLVEITASSWQAYIIVLLCITAMILYTVGQFLFSKKNTVRRGAVLIAISSLFMLIILAVFWLW